MGKTASLLTPTIMALSYIGSGFGISVKKCRFWSVIPFIRGHYPTYHGVKTA